MLKLQLLKFLRIDQRESGRYGGLRGIWKTVFKYVHEGSEKNKNITELSIKFYR
jgi:hypothetical protein